MKRWYVITDRATQQCEFIGVNLNLGYMYLLYCGIKVRFVISAEQYNLAKQGKMVAVSAVTKKEKKQVELVFR